MPNWVFNSLVVSGDKSELDKMVAQLNQPFVKHFPEHKFENGEIVWVADEQFSPRRNLMAKNLWQSLFAL